MGGGWPLFMLLSAIKLGFGLLDFPFMLDLYLDFWLDKNGHD